MGSMQASEFASAVHDGALSLRGALDWHLTANHYPPLPVEYVGIVADVIERVNASDLELDDDAFLPSTLRIVPNDAVDVEGGYSLPVRALLDATHSWSFLDQ